MTIVIFVHRWTIFQQGQGYGTQLLLNTIEMALKCIFLVVPSVICSKEVIILSVCRICLSCNMVSIVLVVH